MCATALLAALSACAGKDKGESASPRKSISRDLRQLRKSITRGVADKERRERALAKIDDFLGLLDSMDQRAASWRRATHEAFARDASEDELLAIAARTNLEVRAELRNAAQVLFAMREDVRPGEWEQIFT